MAAGKRPGKPQTGRARHADLEKFIDGGAASISLGDNAFSIHDNPGPLIRDCARRCLNTKRAAVLQ
ncbi:hypothetical protein ABFV57_33695, partial [Pseudomonas neuropathica]|uniref:hypothetical protein n=1 Tax=Pseudomonas neuropathica TaxID=2730425 RepID=UPI0034D40CEE